MKLKKWKVLGNDKIRLGNQNSASSFSPSHFYMKLTLKTYVCLTNETWLQVTFSDSYFNHFISECNYMYLFIVVFLL